MRKTVLAIGATVFVVIECFLIRLILRSGPDSKEFYTTPISELGKPINDIFFHQEEPPQGKGAKNKRHPANENRESAIQISSSSSGPTYPRTITYEKVEPYLNLQEPLPTHADLFPINGAIVRDPRTVEQAPGDFLGFFFGKAIFVSPHAPSRLIREDDGMMVLVSARTHTFFLAPGTISAILKDFHEVDEVAAEYQLTVTQRFNSLKTAVFKIGIGQDVFMLLEEMRQDPRFKAVTLDLITDLKISLH